MVVRIAALCIYLLEMPFKVPLVPLANSPKAATYLAGT